MPIKRRHITMFCCAVLLLAAGCRSQREAARTAPAATPETVSETPVEQPVPTVPMPRSANFTCSVQGAQASGQLRWQPDSIIWASATKLIELGRAELTPDSVLIYSRVVSRSFRGSYDDIYRRFHYRTTFAEVQAMLTADDADQQIATLLKRLRIDAAVHIGPWKESAKMSFPFSIPANTRPL